MSTKRTSIAAVVAVLVIAVTATTAQARPYPAVDRAGNPTVEQPTVLQGHLPSGHHAAGGPVVSPQPAVPVANSSRSEGLSTTTIVALMGLALLAGALIAIWAAARTGHVTRERPASR
jgi:hypothetical protein